jgi:glucose-fructose oxidoreductase
MDPAYHYAEPLELEVRRAGRRKARRYRVHDQFAAELTYFADCVRAGRVPEPSGLEGEADIRILEAIDRSGRTGRAVRLGNVPRDAAPTARQARSLPPATPPRTTL